VGGAATEMAMPETRTLEKGLIFVKDTNILLSGDKWTVVVNIALDDYDALAYTMKTILNQIRRRIGVHKNPKSFGFDVYWDELNRLDTMVQGFDSDLQSFRKLMFEETLSRNPSIERILQFSEEAVLQSEPTPIHLQLLDEISARTASRSQMRGAEVTRTVNTFRDADPDRHPMSWMWFVGIIILSFVIGSMWPIWVRVIKCGYSYIRKRVPTPAKSLKPLTTQKTNASGTELQEVQLSSEAAFTEEVPEITPSPLTAFVQHGVVTAAD